MSKYNNFSKEDLLKIIEKQESELKTKKYGLVWDSEKEPEQVVLDCENNIPILQRVQEKEIKTDDSDDNILIEGDNYHALTCLNYTHKGKIDVIYIDPPYNTGNKDFVYNDRYIDKEDGYRHSKWLNFMEKRLRLAKNLLSENGLIFISIDDNEQAHLQLLCEKIFGEQNFVFQFVIDKTAQGANQSTTFKQTHEYCLLYTNGKQDMIDSDTDIPVDEKKYKYRDDRGLYAITNSFDSINSPLSSNKNRGYTVYYNDKTGDAEVRDEYNRAEGVFGDFDKALIKKGYTPIRPGIRKGIQYPWNWISSRFMSDYKKDLVFMKNRKGEVAIYHKNRATGKVKDTTLKRFDTRNYGNQMLVDILGEKKFDYPKSLDMMKWVLGKHKNKDALVLDFFSGSGTTGHAVLELNKQDGGSRKFILCTNNENNICEEVTYPRLEKVIKGYNKNGNGDFVKGLNGNLQYFKTDLIPVERIDNINDQQRNELTKKAGQMIAIKENTFEEIETNEWYQIFENKDKSRKTAIYFRENMDEFEELLEKIGKTDTILYVFSYSRIDKKTFNYLGKNIVLEDIPEPILEIYKEINLTLRESLRRFNLKNELTRAQKHIENKNKEDGARVLRICIENIIHEICFKNSINFQDKKTSYLNDELKRMNILDKIFWEKNKTFIAIGNDASHGVYDGFNLKDLQDFYDHIINIIDMFNIK